MSISLLLEMAVSGDPERIALVDGGNRLTTGQLSHLADGGAGLDPLAREAVAALTR